MSLLRNRRAASRGAAALATGSGELPVQVAYNIIPFQDVVMHGDHPSLRFPEVRATVEALAHGADLPPPVMACSWYPHRADLFDWLGATFNHPVDVLHHSVARGIRKKLLKNYASWCAYLGQKTHIRVPGGGAGRRRTSTAQGFGPDIRKDLLYTALYLLI
ncbi:hypothetical protein GUJ93_ZPchr0001g31865 [Zizania palustris]|uniref:Uncharacterized protein n=1 Tax=Zizania palustris TaxID=103762 RepID=A0A8J5RV44_ZIZPA|nr:hypothetical protein GUJ93_ZPchr0001g31865 [Zizania palustris]